MIVTSDEGDESSMWWFAVPLVAVIVIALAACSGSPGPLRADTRVRNLEPAPGSTVDNPVTIRWESTFEPGEASGLWFAVYLDFSMTPPGQSALVGASEPCATAAECLEKHAMEGPFVWLTDQQSIDVGALLAGAHRYTIILVDENGIRDGAVAWNASFRVS